MSITIHRRACSVIGAGALLAALSHPLSAGAQHAAPARHGNRFAFTLGGAVMNGVERPLDATSTMGLHGFASVEVRSPLQPLRARVDGLVGGWSTSRMSALSAVTASAVLMPMPRWRLSPYVTAGGGAYFSRGQSAAPGWTLGAGVQLPTLGHALILETRMHAYRNRTRVPMVPELNNDERYIWSPISVGFRF